MPDERRLLPISNCTDLRTACASCRGASRCRAPRLPLYKAGSRLSCVAICRGPQPSRARHPRSARRGPERFRCFVPKGDICSAGKLGHSKKLSYFANLGQKPPICAVGHMWHQRNGLICLRPGGTCERFDVRADHQKPLALSLEFPKWI
jgi:hypothetical protein